MSQQGLELTQVQVGSPFPLFAESAKRLKGADGAFFEADEMNQGYMFCIYYSGLTSAETNAIRSEKVRMRLHESGGLLLPMMRFGETMMIFEIVFDPTLYEDDRALQFVNANNTITIFGIDSNTNIVKTIRAANLPLKMIQACKVFWSKAILDVGFSGKFKKWYAQIQNIPLETLWEGATEAGELGESYNLEEIKHKA